MKCNTKPKKNTPMLKNPKQSRVVYKTSPPPPPKNKKNTREMVLTTKSASMFDDLNFPAHQHTVIAFEVTDELNELVPEVLLHNFNVSIFRIVQAFHSFTILAQVCSILFILFIRKPRIWRVGKIGRAHV